MIETRNLTKIYPKTQRGIKNVNLTVERGSFFALLGRNGAGKSTLVKILCNIVTDYEGEALIDGFPPHTIEARKRLSYLPELLDLPEYLTAYEYLFFMAQLAKVELDEELVKELSQILEFPYLDTQIRTFSKGTRQKLALISTLAMPTPLLILDEPMSGLDPIARVALKTILQRLRNERTIFFVSHILTDIESLADRIAIIEDGSIIYTGGVQELKERYGSSNLEEAFIKTIDHYKRERVVCQ